MALACVYLPLRGGTGRLVWSGTSGHPAAGLLGVSPAAAGAAACHSTCRWMEVCLHTHYAVHTPAYRPGRTRPLAAVCYRPVFYFIFNV